MSKQFVDFNTLNQNIVYTVQFSRCSTCMGLLDTSTLKTTKPQWRNLSAAAPANAGGPEGPKGPTKMVYQICERLVNVECKTLKRVVFTSDIQAWA